jgi:hypothetical protein
MFPFPDVMHLFTDEFTGLGTWPLALSLLLFGPLNRLFFRHTTPP